MLTPALIGFNREELTIAANLDFSFRDLRGADFRLADLSLTSLFRANLQGARFGGARLFMTQIGGADFSGADLRGAWFYNCITYRWELVSPEFLNAAGAIWNDATLFGNNEAVSRL